MAAPSVRSMTFHLTNTPNLSRQSSFFGRNSAVTLPRVEGIVEATEQSPLLPPVAQDDLEIGSADSSLPRPSTDVKLRAHAITSDFHRTDVPNLAHPSRKRSRWTKFQQRAQYYVPALQWMPEYRLDLSVHAFSSRS